jgi:hypothetical protein
MSRLFSQLKNNIMYQLNAATYNPDAEEYAAQQEAEAAEAVLTDKSKADISGADISGADISGADLSGADLSGADISGVMCFGPSIQLGPTNFFKDDEFENYIKTLTKSLGKNSKKKYSFSTLNEAKVACQTMTETTGILAIDSRFYLYTGDATLVNTPDPKSPSTERILSQNPIITFTPAMTCEAMADAEERKTFSVKRLINRVLKITSSVLGVFLLIALGLFGASLATNLNVYRGWPYRLLYMVYGAVFFLIVIPYVLLWRWLYQHKRPRFYALIPLISTPIQNPLLATLLSWFTFEPDDEIAYLDGCRA